MIRSVASAKAISHFLAAPGKVASTLNWKKQSGSVLSLLISKEKIDLALASHPECRNQVRIVEPIPLTTHTVENCKVLDESVARELMKVIAAYNVCGIVVGWPVEKEGWCGASCGRVLYTLDQLVNADTETDVLKATRPLCLYDMNHHIPSEDEWGRSAVYSEICNKKVHVSSERELYQSEDTSEIVTSLWNDFCKTHWPDVTAFCNPSMMAVQPEIEVDDFEDDSAA